MHIPKVGAINFRGIKLNNARKMIFAAAATTALLASASEAKAQDPKTYTFGGSANATVVKIEDYQALQLKFQQAIAERQAAQNQINNYSNEASQYGYNNQYINIDYIEESVKKDIMTNSILEGIGFFILGAFGGILAKAFGKND